VRMWIEREKEKKKERIQVFNLSVPPKKRVKIMSSNIHFDTYCTFTPHLVGSRP
jgi:hypothetical protein